MFLGTFFFFFGIGAFLGIVYVFFRGAPIILKDIYDVVKLFFLEIKKGLTADLPEDDN